MRDQQKRTTAIERKRANEYRPGRHMEPSRQAKMRKGNVDAREMDSITTVDRKALEGSDGSDP